MAEYIERTEIERFIAEHGMVGPFSVDLLPSADVAPVRHGRWIETPRLYYGAKQYECSLCYSDTFWNKHSIYEKYPYCPNCGAKMDLKGEDHED